MGMTVIEAFEGLKDPRMDRTRRHKLTDILVIALTGAICGVDNWVELERFGNAKKKWFGTFLDLPNGIPSHDTLGRVFAALDPDGFRRSFISWVEGLGQVKVGDVIAIDGKTIRRSLDKAKGRKPLHLLNAWASEAGVAVGQLATEEKSNEITAIPKLLEQLHVAGCIVTTDAMGCQKKIAEKIRDKEADYVLQLRGNHPTMHAEVVELFEGKLAEQLAAANPVPDETKLWTMEHVDGGHGRVETRRYWLTTDIEWFEDRADWADLRAFGMVEATREFTDGKVTRDRRYFITSLTNIDTFARSVRSHWGVENSLHWVLDMAFDEDHSRVRMEYAAENAAILRQVALNLLKQEKMAKVGIKTKRKMCGWDHDYLLAILGLRDVPEHQRG